MDNLTQNIPNYTELHLNESDEDLVIGELTVFILLYISGCALASLLVVMSAAATIALKRWRKNIRNQLLMQLIIARCLNRIVNVCIYLQEIIPYEVLRTLNIYVDLVILMLIIFFIKHMYESLIIVVVKMNKSDLYKMTGCSWLLPIAPAGVYVAVVEFNKLVGCWLFHLILCVAIRWPLMIAGTFLYLRVLYRVLTDKSRYYAKHLTITTFLICLVVNAYAIGEDVIKLWSDTYFHIILNAVLGLVLDFLNVCLFVILLLKARNKNVKTKRAENNVI